MKKSGCIRTIGLAALLLTAVTFGLSPVQDAWGQAFGMIAATVDKADDTRGLTVRSEPSDSGQPLGYLPIGSEIRACNQFKDGWVKLDDPARGGWLNMSNLKPVGGQGKVVAVDTPDLCLIIRKGPGSTYERIGCAELGQKLNLTGVWSETNWARLDTGGWVDATKIDTDLMTCQTPLDAQPPTAQDQELPPAVSSSGGEVPGYVEGPSYSNDDYGVPYFYGDYGGYGYYPGVFPFGAVIVVDRRFKRHHHHHHHHDFDRSKGVTAARDANNKRASVKTGGVSPRPNFGSLTPGSGIVRSGHGPGEISPMSVTRRSVSPSFSPTFRRVTPGPSMSSVGFRNTRMRVNGFSNGWVRSGGLSSSAIRSGGFGIGRIGSGGLSAGGGSSGGGGHRR
jgi:hypothetical protein